MNKEDLITKIGAILDKIKSHKNPTEESSESELQGLLDDSEDLVESVSVLKFIVNEGQRPIKIPSDTISEEELTEDYEPETLNQEDEPSENKGEQIKEPIIEEKEIGKNTELSEPKEDKKSTKKEQIDLFPSEESSLNEKISQESFSVATKLEKQKIADLIGAIGINERFTFINELFEGNSDDFNEALKKLNSFAEYKEACVYLDAEVRSKYNWDEENQVVLEFLDLIEKRYVD